MTQRRAKVLRAAILSFVIFAAPALALDQETETRLRKLAEQNEQLQRTVAAQNKTITTLSEKVSQLEVTRGEPSAASSADDATARKFLGALGSQTKVNISGQVAAGFFKTGREGMFPNGEFRLDDARIALDVRAWEDVYGFVELELTTRETPDENTHLGEVYIDLEQVLKWRGLDSLVNFRIGRFYTPFGEEYLVRYPIDDPLITHSLSDFWAFDEGIEVYGSHGQFQYAFAIQNGGVGALRDFTDDKTFAGRVAYEPTKWLRLSASGMRTGDTSARDDGLTAMWFGNGFFRSIGSPATTRFHADMWEGDAQLLLPRGHVKVAGGAIYYNDNDPFGENSRTVYHYYAEGLYRFAKQFYAAARYSQVLADGGFPVIGNGTWGQYFFRELTDNLWRASIGLGYTPNPNFVVKVEYMAERGTTVSGKNREHEDFLGAQAVVRF